MGDRICQKLSLYLWNNKNSKDMEKQNLINDSILWSGIKEYVTRVGRISARPVVILYYVLKKSEIPKSDKLLIYAAIAYLVLPIDLISAQRLPIIGSLDEVATLSMVLERTTQYITPEMLHDVDVLLDRWFSGDAFFEIVHE